MVKKVLMIALLIMTLTVGCAEMQTSQPGESGYETITIVTKNGENRPLYKITSDEYYFQPGSALYEEVPYYDRKGYEPVGRHITYIELTGEEFTCDGYRLSDGIMSEYYHETYWTSKKPIKIDEAIAEAKRLDEQFEEDLEVIYLTKDGETVESRYIISDFETYIIPYEAEVYTITGSLGTIKGIDPLFGGFAGRETGPAYFTRTNYIGTFGTGAGYEITKEPIRGNISDVIKNPEKYSYPKEAIGKQSDVEERMKDTWWEYEILTSTPTRG
ncbi:MAG: hypothetical protein WC180_06940 [Candidatus Paceibacterota bacterium]|jgi:hypothetical protein